MPAKFGKMSTDNNYIDIQRIDTFMEYLWSIEWRDPWLIALFIFHLTVFMMAIFTRHYGNFQILIFIGLLLLVFFSEKINELAFQNWMLFSRQQYFDSNGLFISVVFSTPILLNCMLMVGSWLYQSTQLMKDVKLRQLEERLRKERKEQNITAEQRTETPHPKID